MLPHKLQAQSGIAYPKPIAICSKVVWKYTTNPNLHWISEVIRRLILSEIFHQTGAPTLTDMERDKPQTGKNLFNSCRSNTGQILLLMFATSTKCQPMPKLRRTPKRFCSAKKHS